MDVKSLIDEATLALNAHDIERFAALHDENGEFVQSGVPGTSKAELIAGIKALLDGVADLSFTIDDIVIQGDKAFFEGKFKGTQSKPLHLPGGPEIPATGKRISVGQSVHVTVRNDKAVKVHVFADRMELMEQLGLMPQPQSARG